MADYRPRYLVKPGGIVANGYEPIRAVLRALKISTDPWQDEIGRYMHALGADGLYTAKTVGMSIPRQSGKTYLVYMNIIADCIVHPGTFVVWSAQHSSVASETAREIISVCARPEMSRYIDPRRGINRAKFREEITFRNGSRIVFKCRSNGSIRGVPKVRRLVLDEAQIVGPEVLPDMLPTMNAAWNPQVVLMGTPPKPSDAGEVFTQFRASALAGEADDVFYAEYSADESLDMDDEETWRIANPGFAAGRVGPSALRTLRRMSTNDDDFAREALGRWDRADNGEIITEAVWDAAEDVTSQITGTMALAVDVGPDAAYASIAVAGARADGRSHVELVEQRKGTSWVVPYVRGFLAANPNTRAVVLDIGSAARVLVDDFTREKVKLTHPRVAEVGDACLRFVDGLSSGEVVHIGQPQLNLSRQGARKRPLGTEGMWAWSRKSSVSDITPIVAATLALWGAQTINVARPTVTRRGGKVVIPW